MVSDIEGGHRYLETGHLITGNPKVFKAMTKALHPMASRVK